MMSDNALKRLNTFGQSPWQDFIRRKMIESGELGQMIDEDGLRGVTSNPSIFEKVIIESGDYDSSVEAMVAEGLDKEEIYTRLTVEDVRSATDVFRPVYDRLEGKDGFVSLEVNPHLAHDTKGTIEEAQNLWGLVDRPNVMIKVPATLEGLPAIRELISEGINVNVTLLFGLPRYREVAEAYIAGLEERLARKRPIDRIASVASFFLSRIDVLVDPKLKKIGDSGGAKAKMALDMRGQVAIASAKQAYLIYEDIFKGSRFKKLMEQGARPQRLLWASTSTKNPDYADTKYVEPLIGPETVNTMPQETLDAYRDHGRPEERIHEGQENAARVLANLKELGLNIDEITQQLEDEGVDKFNKPFDKLMDSLAEKTRQIKQ